MLEKALSCWELVSSSHEKGIHGCIAWILNWLRCTPPRPNRSACQATWSSVRCNPIWFAPSRLFCKFAWIDYDSISFCTSQEAGRCPVCNDTSPKKGYGWYFLKGLPWFGAMLALPDEEILVLRKPIAELHQITRSHTIRQGHKLMKWIFVKHLRMVLITKSRLWALWKREGRNRMDDFLQKCASTHNCSSVIDPSAIWLELNSSRSFFYSPLQNDGNVEGHSQSSAPRDHTGLRTCLDGQHSIDMSPFHPLFHSHVCLDSPLVWWEQVKWVRGMSTA